MAELTSVKLEHMMAYIIKNSSWYSRELRNNIARMFVNELQECPEKDELLKSCDGNVTVNLNGIAEYKPQLIVSLYNMCVRAITMLSQKRES